jgi:hypothetical protein
MSGIVTRIRVSAAVEIRVGKIISLHRAERFTLDRDAGGAQTGAPTNQ